MLNKIQGYIMLSLKCDHNIMQQRTHNNNKFYILDIANNY